MFTEKVVIIFVLVWAFFPCGYKYLLNKQIIKQSQAYITKGCFLYIDI